ncbi:hypothetical protein B0H11DRAFT_1759356, partial [Mycena galericulata]
MLEDLDDEPGSADEITLKFGKNGKFTATANQSADYQYRGAALEHINVWDFVSQVEKIRLVRAHRSHKKISKKLGDGNDTDDEESGDSSDAQISDIDSDRESDDGAENESGWDEFSNGEILDWSGRTRPRVCLQEGHLEDRTHILRVLTPGARRVPVPIGPALPRRDHDDSRHRHARLMLILFKPWRHASDLLSVGQSWIEAYEEFLAVCSSEVLTVINNMQLLHECKDSRDAHYANRR